MHTVVLMASLWLFNGDFGICTATNSQYYPCAIFQNNQYYVFWSDFRYTGEYCVYGARISSSGTVLDPNGKVLFRRIAPEVPVVASQGTNLLVVFRDSVCAYGNILGTLVTQTCDTINSFYISKANFVQWQPDVTYGAGNYFAVWTDGRGANFHVYGTRITPSGIVLDTGGIYIGQTSTTVSHYYPEVAFDGTRYLAVWHYIQRPYGITGRFIETDGTPAETTRIYSDTCYCSALRLGFDGINYLVVWIENANSIINVKGQLVAKNGTLIGLPFIIASGVSESSLGLCFDGANYLVTWSANQIWGRKYDRNGQPVGNAFRISVSTNRQEYCAVTPGTNNRYLSAWSEYTATGIDVYGNIDVLINRVEGSARLNISNCSLYPTLVTDMIVINNTNGRPVSIFDASGRRIGITTQGCFDCRNLRNGIYFVRVASGEQFKVIKIR